VLAAPSVEIPLGTFTDPVSWQRKAEGAPARVPWSPRCVARRRPLLPGRTSSAPGPGSAPAIASASAC